MFRPENRQPDFRNIEAVLSKSVPSRPTLFEFFMNGNVYSRLLDSKKYSNYLEELTRAFDSAGYDFVNIMPADYSFVDWSHEHKSTISLNENSYIFDRESFDKFVWKKVSDCSFDEFASVKNFLPNGMKVIPYGPSGVLENTIELVGFENLCMMIYDDEQLVYDIFEKVGQTLLDYYKPAVEFDFVGAIISNDDWGFKTQTMLSPENMRKFVFPWHKKIVELAHSKGLPAILHSCGYYGEIIDDVINDMKYDGRHSYEDAIVPVEQAYEELKGKIAVMGGLDVDFVIRHSKEEIVARASAMIERSSKGGGYALGTGNSVPEYIPTDNYLAMISAAFK